MTGKEKSDLLIQVTVLNRSDCMSRFDCIFEIDLFEYFKFSLRDGPFNLQGGGGGWFFLKKKK